MARAGSRPVAQRAGNATFYLIAEGEGTEYDYFGWLNTTYGQDRRFHIKMPHAQKNGLTPSRVVGQVCDLMKDREVDQVWGLFDHDDRGDIDQVCARAQREHANVALSHPSFESWLLLHFHH